jgi:RNA 2',3'-cyclic 3'-phosphodiesterase
MPRLFTGLEIPADTARMLMLHRGGIIGARWIEPSDFHITLRFLGDVDRHVARDAAALLDDIHPAGPITVTLDGLSAFGGDKPRAVFASVRPGRELSQLQGDHERLMRQIGLAPESRKFIPHVTLARMKDVSPMEVAHYLSTHAIVHPISFTASRFVLYSSRASTGGGPYVIEAAYPFAQPSRYGYG